MENNKRPLIDTVKEWGSLILSALGIVFLLTSLRRDGNNDNSKLEGEIKDVEDNIKDIELSDPNIDEIINRWNERK